MVPSCGLQEALNPRFIRDGRGCRSGSWEPLGVGSLLLRAWELGGSSGQGPGSWEGLRAESLGGGRLPGLRGIRRLSRCLHFRWNFVGFVNEQFLALPKLKHGEAACPCLHDANHLPGFQRDRRHQHCHRAGRHQL